jgi:hypothetical protein
MCFGEAPISRSRANGPIKVKREPSHRIQREIQTSERSFLYLLYAIREELQNPRRVLESGDWRMFLMTPADVEREILLLHQYRKLDYHVAGSIVELNLLSRCT